MDCGSRSGLSLARQFRNAMQQIYFAIGHFLDNSFKILVTMDWMPVVAISILLGVGLVYWLNMQGKYNAAAKRDGTLI